jgi:hypothetical protein
MVAGVGFTVALFVTSISLTDPALIDSAKVGILGGSLIAGTLGFCFLRWAAPAPAEPPPDELDGGPAAVASRELVSNLTRT